MITGIITDVSTLERNGAQYSVVTIRVDVCDQLEHPPAPSDFDRVQQLVAAAGLKLGGPLGQNEDQTHVAHADLSGPISMTVVRSDGNALIYHADNHEFGETTAGYALYRLYFTKSENELRPFIGKQASLRQREPATIAR